MRSQFKYLFILAGIFSFLMSRAQLYDDDAAIWAYVYLEKKVSKKFQVHLKQQNRINNNISEYGLGYADVGMTYRFNKHVKILADYVFSGKRRLDASYSLRHQFYTSLTLKQKFRKFTFSYRNLLQLQMRDIYSSEDGKVPIIYERNKVTVKYELNKRYSFYIAEELYLPFYQAKNKGLDRSRSFAGVLYNLTKANQLEFYFALQHQLNSFKITKRVFIYGIGYSIEF